MVLMVQQNHEDHLIRRFAGRGNKTKKPRDVKDRQASSNEFQELEFSQLQQDSPIKEAKTESNISDNGSEDVNPFGGGNPGFHDESEPIIWDIGDEEEEYPFVNKILSLQEKNLSCPIDEERRICWERRKSKKEDKHRKTL
ncbi:hypothetical protein Tco_0406945 [Tanacetum coccineum]